MKLLIWYNSISTIKSAKALSLSLWVINLFETLTSCSSLFFIISLSINFGVLFFTILTFWFLILSAFFSARIWSIIFFSFKLFSFWLSFWSFTIFWLLPWLNLSIFSFCCLSSILTVLTKFSSLFFEVALLTVEITSSLVICDTFSLVLTSHSLKFSLDFDVNKSVSYTHLTLPTT